MKFFTGIYALISLIRSNLIYIAISIMIINVTLGVFFRYVLNDSLSWTEELARYLMVWFALLGMSLAMRDNEHVSVSYFLGKMRASVVFKLKIINYILVIIFLFLLLKYSIGHLKVVKMQTSPSIGIPMYLPYSAISIGSFLMIIECIRHLYQHLFNRSR